MSDLPARQFIVTVHAKVPPALSRLEELSANLWYSWHRPTRALFGPLDPDLWNRVGHNPKLFLRRVDQQVLERAATDDVYLSHYHEVLSAYDTYLNQSRRAPAADGFAEDDLVAYFCAEYGLHESLPVYSGGLGILAGHHCKTASDMRLPFLAVGLFYHAGYFSQSLDGDGTQLATYVELNPGELPITTILDEAGEELRVGIDFPGRTVFARVWRARAGHVHLYLLDTNVIENAPSDRLITHQLYGGGSQTRIEQELILGIGGVRALRALGFAPTVWHLNEGHAAFSTLELARELIADGRDFDTALEAVAACTVFTTHTPVPAGHDHFSKDMTAPYLEPYATQLGLATEQLHALGLSPESGTDFNMTALAIRGSRYQNGVSRLHGAISSRICQDAWPQVPAEENPMDYITNGVHVPTVLAQEWVDLFDRVFGAEWRNHLSDSRYWERVYDIQDHHFWAVRQTIKSHTLAAVAQALRVQHTRNQLSEPHIDRLLRQINPANPNVLTIGFARRFATYKRATLLLRDLDRLYKIVSDPERPVVFLFAGKAHPADQPGQEQLRRVHEVSQTPEFFGKLFLVEGYDLSLARRLLCGVDVWLNTPVYTMEASGTSGMKAGMNGAINLSVTDGWWAEGYDGENGWAIKPSSHADDTERRDDDDAQALYELLEEQVLPKYYAHGKYGFSSDWVSMSKHSLATIVPRYNMNRVLEQYTEFMYVPAALGGRRLRANNLRGAETLARWRTRVQAEWPNVSLTNLGEAVSDIQHGDKLEFDVVARLGTLTPGDVRVELLMHGESATQGPGLYGGFLAEESRLDSPTRADSKARIARFGLSDNDVHDGEYRYRLSIEPDMCGQLTCEVRIYPFHESLTHPLELGLMEWLT